MRRRLLAAAVAVPALLLSGCATQATATDPAAPEPTTAAAAAPVPADLRPVLAAYGITQTTTTDVIDALDQTLVEDRRSDLMASVRVDELLLTTADGAEHTLDIPDDTFYLSLTPYVNQTHECFYHSLTTCKGELSAVEVEAEIVTDDGEVLVDGTHTTFDNGFVGFWLPRDIDGTLTVTYDGKTGQTPIATDAEAPTCLTTLQLT